jgi:hypothetical protein
MARKKVRRLNNAGHFILLLDGFDEMGRLVTAAERRLSFHEICRQVTGKNKVIVSGRPGYFPDNNEMLEVLDPLFTGGPPLLSMSERALFSPEVEVRCIQLMDDTQLKEFVEKAIGTTARATQIVEQFIPQKILGDLARRPVLTGMIVDSAERLAAMSVKSIGLKQLYDVYIENWTRREADKGFFRLLIDREKKSDFLGLLALQMHFTGESRVNYRDLDISIRDHFSLTRAEEVDHFSHDIRTCSFLRRCK